MTKKFTGILFAACMAAARPGLAADAVTLKPFILGSAAPGTIAARLPEVKAALEREGFKIAGEYSPYKGVQILAVTNDALKSAAAKSEFGGYGAAERVALTEVEGALQVSYVNPLYTAQAYRMAVDLADTAAALRKALGEQEAFGSEKGLKPAKLRKYRYMVAMPSFAGHNELAKYPSQEAALKAVEAGLAAHKGGTSLVYRVDVPGGAETVFGVGLAEGKGADAAVMKVTDKGPLKHSAHLPYELLVSGGKVYALHGKFRIALNFPDLSMGTFMKISGAPGAIEDALTLAAGKGGAGDKAEKPEGGEKK